MTTKKPKDKPAVFELTRASRCYTCDKKLEPGTIVRLEDKGDENQVLCLSCAGLTTFKLLAGGNTKATRLASKYSSTQYVVFKWSEIWKCYERRGLLVEQQVLEKVAAELGQQL